MKMRKRRFKDRFDARFCDDVNGMNQIAIDLKPRRSLGELYINQVYDVTNLVKYIEEHKKNNNSEYKLTYFHAFTTAIAKTIYNRPLLNRFVQNRHVYEHNDVVLSYVMKINFDDKSEEVMTMLPVLENDNIFSISKKTTDKVKLVREKGDTGTGANDAIQVLSKLPNLIRIPIVSIFKFMDRHGILPASLVKDNLYYSSMIISNIGTFHCNGIYHNVTDFGTCSGLITIGEVKKVGTKYVCEFGVTIDERIGDGFYFIKSLQLLQYILDNPKLLEGSANEKIEIK